MCTYVLACVYVFVLENIVSTSVLAGWEEHCQLKAGGQKLCWNRMRKTLKNIIAILLFSKTKSHVSLYSMCVVYMFDL